MREKDRMKEKCHENIKVKAIKKKENKEKTKSSFCLKKETTNFLDESKVILYEPSTNIPHMWT